MVEERLEMTPYLEGLKKLFDEYGVTVAYSYSPFINRRVMSTVLYADSIDMKAANKITWYMSDLYEHPEEDPWAFCLPIGSLRVAGAHCVYKEGVFYS